MQLCSFMSYNKFSASHLFLQIYICLLFWKKRFVYLVFFLVSHPTQEFFTHMETSPLTVNCFKFGPMLGYHGHCMSSEGTLTCLTYSDMGHPFTRVISKDPWHSHLLKSIGSEAVFSSPELKAQVSFSDHLSSIVCTSVRLSVNCSHFHLLLQNHWANFNQTWHKVFLVKGDSSLFKWRATPFPKGR